MTRMVHREGVLWTYQKANKNLLVHIDSESNIGALTSRDFQVFNSDGDPEIILSLELKLSCDFGTRFQADDIVTLAKNIINENTRLRRIVVACPVRSVARSNGERESDNQFPTRALTAMLSRTTKLEHFILEHVTLVGAEIDFLALAQTAGTLKDLRAILFGFLILQCDPVSRESRSNDTKESLLDPFIQAVASHPGIECIFVGRELAPLGDLSEGTLARLCESKSLTFLHLDLLSLPDEKVAFFAREMEHNRSINVLNIHCVLDVNGSRAIASLLRVNKTLEQLMLHSNVLDRSNETVVTAHSNRVIATEIIKAIGDSRLRQVEIVSTDLLENGKYVHEALLETVGKNLYLENVTLYANYNDDDLVALAPEITFELHLNQRGRREVLQDFAKTGAEQQWMKLLGNPEVHNNLSYLYYFLSCNPSLCMGC